MALLPQITHADYLQNDTHDTRTFPNRRILKICMYVRKKMPLEYLRDHSNSRCVPVSNRLTEGVGINIRAPGAKSFEQLSARPSDRGSWERLAVPGH